MTPDDPALETDFVAARFGIRLLASAKSSNKTALTVETEGAVIGSYALREKLGRGGFGTVWRAEQSMPVQREVALKIIKLGMDTLEVISRFEQERVALSLMDHPNIAKVLDAGSTPEGRPFFVMELVRGVPMTAYVIEKQLPLEQRLRLFKDICAGVQHAHQKGIIHRDLKPSNILVTEVDGMPVPKIIDFGIAKAVSGDRLTEHTLRTQAEQMIGTPLYMSPEQAEGSADIDTRSDVYALGVLLYELLTGQPPFDAHTLLSAGYEEMRRIICEVEPIAPSKHGVQRGKNDEARKAAAEPAALSSLFIRHSRDLDLITLRALAKDRTRRYESATALGSDLQRFLNHEPVTARAPSALYVAQRWVRRHRVVALAALVCLLAIVAGGTATFWQMREAQAQAHGAKVQEREADAVVDVLLGSLARIQVFNTGKEATARDIIDDAAKALQGMTLSDSRKARIELPVGNAYLQLRAREEAVPHLIAAEQAIIASGAPQERLDLAQMYLAMTYQGLKKYPEAGAVANQVLARLTPGQKRHTQMLFLLAACQAGAGDLTSALARYEEGFAGLGKASPPFTEGYVIGMAEPYPSTLLDAGQPDQALAVAEKLAQMIKSLAGTDNNSYARALRVRAFVQRKRGDSGAAAKDYRQAFEICRTQLGISDGSTRGDLCNLCDVLLDAGRKAEALEVYQGAIVQARKELGNTDSRIFLVVDDVMAVWMRHQMLDEADQEMARWLALLKAKDGTRLFSAQRILFRRILLLQQRGKWPEAEAVARDLLSDRIRFKSAPAYVADARRLIGISLMKQGRAEEALKEFQAAVEGYEAKQAPLSFVERELSATKKLIEELAPGKQ